MAKTKLSKKQKGFVKDYVLTDNATFAAKNNYDIKSKDIDNVAAVIGNENLSKPKIIQSIAEALPDDLLAERHLELLNKREKSIVSHKNKDGDDVFEVLDQPDTNAVKAGLDMAYKIKSTYAPEKSQHFNLTIDITKRAEIKKLSSKVLEELKNGNKPT